MENYDEEKRCLILGAFATGESSISLLHVLCDYSDGSAIDIGVEPKGWPTQSSLCLRWLDQKSNTKVLSLLISRSAIICESQAVAAMES